MMTGREIYKWLRVCGYFDITARVYNSWIKADRHLVGFDGLLFSKEENAKAVMIPRIQLWCDERKLPVRVVDSPQLKRGFKIIIIKK